MTDRPCIWRGHDHPRALRDRHDDDCRDTSQCRGCLPCPDDHCIVCGIEHVARRTCPSCIATTRSNLANLVDLWLRLGAQATHGGTDGQLEAARAIPGGEATVMAGPGSPGQHRATLTAAGRDTSHLEDYRETDATPTRLWVFGWEEDWRNLRRQPTEEAASIRTGVAYLDHHLHWAAQQHDAFDAFASELAAQVSHLEDVVHAGDRPDRGAPCVECNTPLERIWGKRVADDRWWCPRCKERTDPNEYRYAVAADARAYAEWLTASDMQSQYRIAAATLRKWAQRGKVRKRGRDESGRMLYSVADAVAARDQDTKAEIA